ncbi:MAG: thioredoxin family protein [Deltaproteobacteria bacterium]|jgi:glutaredoxin|nr:thioredoxin family protein [Deltaproteobacteria bacterium]MBW2536542.1 thioredoxin family protein [Deltaproteobacteria bacterium]
MLIDLDYDAIGAALRDVPSPIRLVVHPSAAAAALSDEVQALANRIAEAAGGGALVEQGDGAGVPAEPALTLATTERAPIHYLGLPEGREAAPFVEALSGLAALAAGKASGNGAGEAARLAELQSPAELLLFVAPSCPHCPEAVRIATRIALASPSVTVTIVDVQRFEELGKRYHVQSVPRIIIDDRLSFTTVVPAKELVGHLLARGTPDYATRAFDSLIETGRLDAAAAELRGSDGPRLLAHAWKQSTTSSRMALMLTAEELLDEDEAALDGAVAGLLPMLEAEDAALQGDTADLLGRIGHPSAKDAIAKLLDHDNPDVAEIAEEAMEAIDERRSE